MSRYLFLSCLFAVTSFTAPVFAQKSLDLSDKRIATLTDQQGLVSRKTPTDRRWAIVTGDATPVTPGDQIRTGVRGPNAVRVALKSGGTLVIGPGTTVEFGKDLQLKLIEGELDIRPSKGNPVAVRTVGDTIKKIALGDAGVWRLLDGNFSRLEKTPLWLEGYNGVVTTEVMGSLVAKVDGRDVPLTVGYHHVTVEIRDQIARTTIEQSFVNHTKSRTEGVFYFPLPQEASIAGFGMWIGNELVEADVVEKQRAREIYETILRERRDPALLEWTGGNLFKARVFPILPHSEKRVKITYTQVLPLEKDGSYRYRYGLQSDLLRQNPVRDLKVDVRIVSEAKIESALCPSHADARIDVTKNAAHVVVAKEEYTPDADFEFIVKPQSSPDGAEISLIPHQRGEDGYFLMFVQLPELPRAGANENPLDLIVIADTSGSIDPPQRAVQANLMAAILSQLGPDDRFNLVTSDVNPVWWSRQSRRANAETIREAGDFLDRRESMGWSDLAKTFQSVLERAEEGTQVIYLGDGVPATVENIPAGLVADLTAMHQERGVGIFHAVALGATHEPAVMKAIASLGGGSYRRVSGSDTPVTIARAVLDEMVSPGYRDVRVSFEGLQTARVYPEIFTNLPAGSQQFLVGRYLPEGDVASDCFAIVQAQAGDKEIEWKVPLVLPKGDGGNSFIPRLWARQYLDALLEQGGNQAIRDEIIGLSEEYKIMTPYTSFIVLESDEDRERFKVKRRFEMRDGEKFFTEGREAADFQLLQQQMKRAGMWRQNLRMRVLQGLSGMGRGPIQPSSSAAGYGDITVSTGGVSRFARIGHGGYAGSRPGMKDGYSLNAVWGAGETMPVVTAAPGMNFSRSGPMAGSGMDFDVEFEEGDELKELGDMQLFEGGEEEFARDFSGNLFGAADGLEMLDVMSEAAKRPVAGKPVDAFASSSLHDSMSWKSDDESLKFLEFVDYKKTGYEHGARQRMQGNIASGWELSARLAPSYAYPNSVLALFPVLPPTPKEAPVQPPAVDEESKWPEEAQAIIESLERLESLREMGGKIQVSSTYYDTRREDAISGYTVNRVAFDGERWITADGDGHYQWCEGVDGKRSVFHRETGLGRHREAVELDWQQWKPSLGLPAGIGLGGNFGKVESVKVIAGGEADTAWLEITWPSQPDAKPATTRIAVDLARGVFFQSQSFDGDGNKTGSVIALEHAEHAGRHYVKVFETIGADGKRLSRVEIEVSDWDDEFLQEAQDLAAAGITLREMPDVISARRTVDPGENGDADRPATAEDWMALIDFDSRTGQWDEVEKKLASFADAVSGDGEKSESLRWLTIGHHELARQNEDLRLRLLAEGKKIADDDELAKPIRLAQALRLLGSAAILPAGEQLEILRVLRPAFDGAEKWRMPGLLWGRREAQLMDSWQGSNPEERGARWKKLADEYDFDFGLHTSYAYSLHNRREHELADGFVLDQLQRAHWNDGEKWQLRGLLIQWWQQDHRYPELIELVEPLLEEPGLNQYQVQGYLTALSRTGQIEKYDDAIRQWLGAVKSIDGKAVDPLIYAKGMAAIQATRGQAQHYQQFIHPRWEKFLTESAIRFAQHPQTMQFAAQITGNHLFQQLDGYPKFREAVTELLRERGGIIEPAHLQALIRFSDLDEAEWQQIGQEWIKRWRDEDDVNQRRSLGQFIQNQHYRFTGDSAGHLAFLDERLERAENDFKASIRDAIFQELMDGHTAGDLPDEDRIRDLYAMVPMLGPESNEDDDAAVDQQRQARQINGLLAIDDWIVQRMIAHGKKELGDTSAMSRDEKRAATKEINGAALQRVIEALTVVSKLADEEERWQSLAGWIDLELAYYQAKDPKRKDGDELLAQAMAAVGETPEDWPTVEENAIDLARVSRSYETAMALAVRLAAAAPESLAPLEAFIDAGTQLEDRGMAAAWQHQKWRLLVAQDRVKNLEVALAVWADGDEANPAWRLALGYLFAETNRLKKAVAEFEILRKDKLLGASDYAALAGWYQALGQKEEHEKARQLAGGTAGEQALSQAVEAIRNRVQSQNGGPTGQLQQRDIETITELFRRCRRPENYMWQLQSIYQHTKDPRLPASFVGGLLGRSAQEIYPALQRFFDVTRYIEEESSVDEAMSEIQKLREGKTARSEVDGRALDLLEAELKRRASEVLNQPGQHMPAAIAALERAMQRKWEKGERQLMAQWLNRYGSMAQENLREQVYDVFRQLRDGEDDELQQLSIVEPWARTLMDHREYENASDILRDALAKVRAARTDGKFTAELQTAFTTYVNSFAGRKHYADAEKVIHAERERAANPEVSFWLLEQAFANLNNSVSNDGSTSFGSGEKQYQRGREWMLGFHAAQRNQEHRYRLLSRFCALHIHARNQDIEGVGDDAVDYGMKNFPAWIEDHVAVNRQRVPQMVREVGNMIASCSEQDAAEKALAFGVMMIEAEPKWVRQSGDPIWDQLGYSVNQWRYDAKSIDPDLEARTLAIMKEVLTWQFERRYFRNIGFVDNDHSYVWREKIDEFCQIADDFAERYHDSTAAVVFAAQFFADYPNRYSRASDLLLVLHEKSRLDNTGRDLLGLYLETANRWADSERIHRELLADAENVVHRVRLIRALYKQTKIVEMLKTLNEGEKALEDSGRGEQALILMAAISLEVKEYQRAVDWYDEAILKHQETQPNRGVGNGVLSEYYNQLAAAYQGLGQTKGAVDAASAAIVSWGQGHGQRVAATQRLRDVIFNSPDIDQFASDLAKEAEETGLEKPVIRKALGLAYLQKEEFAKAVPHLRAAVEIQPNDAETHRELIRALDGLEDKKAAREQLLASIRLAPRDLGLIADLAQRFQKAENSAAAERALTWLVEAMPNEAEGHQKLAELRTEQKRFDEAIEHWKQVSKIRSLEPTGKLGLVTTYLAANRKAAAGNTFARLVAKKWPDRFSDAIRQVERQLPEKRRP